MRKEIYVKRQPKWLVRGFILLGALLGGIIAFISHPIEGTHAQNSSCTIEIDGDREEYEEVNYGDYIRVYSENHSDDCSSVVKVIYCANEGDYLGEYYSYCEGPSTVTPIEGEIVRYTLNGDLNTIFTAGVLEISGDDTKIFILDRNLGATANGTLCRETDDSTCGYHFQWGNNHGFKPCITQMGFCKDFPNEESTGEQLSSIVYNPFYMDPVFRISNGDNYGNWLSSNSVVDLWGGSTADYIDSLDGDNWKVTNATGRQGPCPESFHVPSYGEWLKIIDILGNDCATVKNNLLIPLAGYRDLGANINTSYYQYAQMWTSSPTSVLEPTSRYVFLELSYDLDLATDYRSNANSVRCVYDSYDTYTKASDLSSEDVGDSLITVNIAALNSGQNTCSGEDYIFPNISALPTVQTISLAKRFSCVFGNAAAKAVTLQLSGDLKDGNGNVISGENVKLSNPDWTATPAALKNGSTTFSGQTFLGTGQTLFNKVANKIGQAYGSGVEIKITIPAGTPDGLYEGTLVLTY